MNGNPRVPSITRRAIRRSDVIGAGCARILLPVKGKRSTIALITPSIWECRLNFGGQTGEGLHAAARLHHRLW
jgi:hypothetical protein